MMLTIHGLPISTKYHDLKVLVKQQCNISDYILDNLVSEGDGTKKVRVGVTNEREGEYVMKCLNGYRLLGSGNVLRVEPVGGKPIGNVRILNAPQLTLEPSRYNLRNNYPSQDYNRQVDPVPGRSDSWGAQNSQWGPSQGDSQPRAQQSGYSYQQPGPGVNQPYGQQPAHQQRPDARLYEQPQGFAPGRSAPQEQRYGFPAKGNEAAARRVESRSNVLRSVEIIDEPLGRAPGQPDKYTAHYDLPQKPITISKDNFQGPSQYGAERQHAPAPAGAHYPGTGHHQGSWDQQTPPEKSQPFGKPVPTQFDRKYPESSSRQPISKTIVDAPRNILEYSKLYTNKGGHGPRLSPRRELPKDEPGPRFSPRRDIPKDGLRFSPRRDMPKEARGPRFSPRRDKDGPGPRFSPRRDKDGPSGPRFSPRRDKDVPSGPRFSPRRDKVLVSRFSPRRDMPKDGPGPRFSPRRDKDGPGPRFSPRRDKVGPGPRFSPRRDIAKDGPGPRFSPRRDKDGPGPRFSPRRDKDGPGPRFSPRRDKDGPGPRFSPRRDKDGPGPRFSPRRDKDGPGPRFSPRRDKDGPGPRFSPRRDKDGPGPRFSPRRDIPKDGPGPRFSPRRDVAIAPHGRRDSPGRRLSPGRRITSPGRRTSPPARRLSPSDRRMAARLSPGRHESPAGHKRASPGRRACSPGRRDSPLRSHAMRYSPTRRHDKPTDNYGAIEPSRTLAKDVRPAFDPTHQAPSQAMYSGGYRPNANENLQYPIPGMRQPERNPPWQQDKTMVPSMKRDEDRREMRMPTFEPRLDANLEAPRTRSPVRKSRSPLRRDRSPPRDRYKKHSPSPRSPRRSWALEKRRSPDLRDAPPPPLWPGQNPGDDPRNRSNFPERVEDKIKRTPVWDRPLYDEKSDRRDRHPAIADRFPAQPPIRVRTDLVPRPAVAQPTHPVHREASPHDVFKPDERYPQREPIFEPRAPESKFDIRERDPKFEPRSREPKFEPREDFPELRPDFRRPDMERKQYDRPEFREVQRPAEEHRQDMHSRHLDRREEFTRREERKELPKPTESFNKEVEDVYKRAVEFNKKTLEFRKGADRRRDDYADDRGRREPARHEPKDYDRQKFIREDDRDDPRQDFRHTDEIRHREEFPQRSREPEWKIDDGRLSTMSPSLRAKREKAIDQIADRILVTHGSFKPEFKTRIMEELKLSVARIMKDMFGTQDVSFIEMVIKFNAKFEAKDQIKILQDVMSSLPSHFRTMKRHVEEPARAPEVPAKSARHSHEHHMNTDMPRGVTETHLPEWDMNLHTQNIPIMGISHYEMVPQMVMIPPELVPTPTFVQAFEEVPEKSLPRLDPADDGSHNLYLCKDDFEPYSDNQADYLKKFLVSQILKVSESGNGWAPDFTLKGLQSMYRYELVTRDDSTKDWILKLDFSQFTMFNVLVYTKEELWYERAAIWLPGHSRYRNIEPLEKLKQQNKRLEGANVGKWKFVKKIVTSKGTRLYVDMPPSSARALEKYKMMLSYELQKVSVYLKAVAVDKDAFDSGLKAYSITDPAEILTAAQNSPMPSLGHDSNIIKIALKGNKALSVIQARKIKEMIVYHIFKYHQEFDFGRTDFLKYGFCLPGYFGVVPENHESKRWLMSLDIGKLNRHAVVVLGADESSTKYIKMTISMKNERTDNPSLLYERLKHSNQGVKGINFNLWKKRSVYDRFNRTKFEFDIDLESVETLVKMHFKLDYVDEKQNQHTVMVRYEHSKSKLDDLIKRYKAELNDSYDVANMDIASSDDDGDIVYMGEVRK